MNSEFDLEHIFSYHPGTPEQCEKYNIIRAAGKDFARTILETTPPSADQSVAIRLIREAVAIANASVALEGRLYK